MSTTEGFVILPYLKTSENVYIRGISFRSSKDLDGLSENTVNHLQKLFSLFYLNNDEPISTMCYAIVKTKNQQREHVQALRRQLQEARALISYFYASPGKTAYSYLSNEHASMFTFSSGKIFKRSISESGNDNEEGTSGLVDGYEGSINHETAVSVSENDRIYPHNPRFWLNKNQDLYHDFERILHHPTSWAFYRLFHETDENPTIDRIFTAMEWYNRSNSMDTREDVALVHLAIAFESLFQLSQGEKLADRFKETVITLLGPIPRLDSWVDQFYSARSKIVHTGQAGQLGFYPVNKDRLGDIRKGKIEEMPYQKLSSYGRRVFRLCLNIVLTGSQLVEDANLPAAFVHNQERLEKICLKLSKRDADPLKQIYEISQDVYDLGDNWMDIEHRVKPETAFAAGRFLLSRFLETQPQLPETLASEIKEILGLTDNKNTKETLAEFKKLTRKLTEWMGRVVHYERATIRSAQPQEIVHLLLSYISIPAFKLEYLWNE